jgi:hypothetical protein
MSSSITAAPSLVWLLREGGAEEMKWTVAWEGAAVGAAR